MGGREVRRRRRQERGRAAATTTKKAVLCAPLLDQQRAAAGSARRRRRALHHRRRRRIRLLGVRRPRASLAARSPVCGEDDGAARIRRRLSEIFFVIFFKFSLDFLIILYNFFSNFFLKVPSP